MALDQKILDYQLTPQEADRIMNMVLERAVGSSIVKDGGGGGGGIANFLGASIFLVTILEG